MNGPSSRTSSVAYRSHSGMFRTRIEAAWSPSAYEVVRAYASHSAVRGGLVAGRADLSSHGPLGLVRLTELMARTVGSPDIKIGLIDGAVAIAHPSLVRERLHEVTGGAVAACAKLDSAACVHGTFIAGILSAERSSPAPAICPGCDLLIRPIFAEMNSGRDRMPSATPQELATAMIECIDAGARVLNLSLALTQSSAAENQSLSDAFDLALKRGVIVVAAAGNQGSVVSSVITRHPWVIPVAACDLEGKPVNESNLSGSIGRRGLSAPGDHITSLGPDGKTLTLGGTSVAAPFVTGTIALLWSQFPTATAGQIKLAVTQSGVLRRAMVVPPLLNAAAAFATLSTSVARR
jgi:subtilisin family serine protease